MFIFVLVRGHFILLHNSFLEPGMNFIQGFLRNSKFDRTFINQREVNITVENAVTSGSGSKQGHRWPKWTDHLGRSDGPLVVENPGFDPHPSQNLWFSHDDWFRVPSPGAWGHLSPHEETKSMKCFKMWHCLFHRRPWNGCYNSARLSEHWPSVGLDLWLV